MENITTQTDINSKNLLHRFLKYVQIESYSNSTNADNGIQPSTPSQWDFANFLKDELKNLGITDITLTEHCYLCARLPATPGFEHFPSVGFLAHMDGVEGVSTLPVRPITINTDSGDTIIKSSGDTILSADDKAGVAIIISATEEILQNNIPHCQIELIFSPDEETGHGMDNVPLTWIQSKQCYTVDGGGIGEIEAECFNAYKSVVTFQGLAKHTGTARPNMANATTMAAHFVAMLPQNESPEATDGYLGFFAPMEISGTMEEASVTLFLRDFDAQGMGRRLEAVETFAKAVEAKFPTGKVSVKHTQQYLNMKEKLDKTPQVMEKLIQAVKDVGIEPIFNPIRGGTDGSRLTELGIPTPNIFTGGHNFHSKDEWASLYEMTKSCETIIQLIKLYTK